MKKKKAKKSSKIKYPSFGHVTEVFVNHLNILDDATNQLWKDLRSRKDRDFSDFKKFVEPRLKKHQKKQSIRFTRPEIQKFNRLHENWGSSNFALGAVPRGMFSYLIAEFDTLLGYLLKQWIYRFPGLLDNSEMHLGWFELAKFKKIDEARDYLIAKKVETLLRDSHSSQVEWIEKNLGVEIKSKINWPKFIEITERRNLFIHTYGEVSEQYIHVCRKHNALETGIKIGDELGITQEYFKQSIVILLGAGVKIAQILRRKTDPKSLEEPDEQIDNLAYSLIANKKYEAAIELLEFATTHLKASHSEEARLIFLVNKAQAYKWLNDRKKVNAIINDIDWSALSNEFRLAKAVLADEFGSAADLMKKIGCGRKNSNKWQYHEWPLFKEFRKTKEFLAAYKQIFKESFVDEAVITDQELSI